MSRIFSRALATRSLHTPVLLPEVFRLLQPRAGEIYCDATFGGGGYTRAVLDSCDCKVMAVDQDPTAVEQAKWLAGQEEYRDRLFPVLGRFGDISRLVKENLGWSTPCFHGMLFDIGVSSAQLETPSRGFSYKLDGPLDMRMFSRGTPIDDDHAVPVKDEEQRLLKGSITAYEVVNFFPQEKLADIIYQYGEERFSRKIATAIVQARQEQPLATTSKLAAVVQHAVPAPRWHRSDDEILRSSAARTFQAIRIYVNNELEQLRNALRASEHLLHPGGRLLVVTFHSLEDRMVKNFMHRCSGRRALEDNDRPTNQFALKRAAYRNRSGFGQGSDHQQPVLAEEPSFELLGHKVVQAGEEERERNSRSRSAKLRGAVRTAARAVEPFGSVE